MPKGKPSEITIRIRNMAKIERLKDKIAKARIAEAARAERAAIRLNVLVTELRDLEDSCSGQS